MKKNQNLDEQKNVCSAEEENFIFRLEKFFGPKL
jgi:hypothetical protein